jgi:RNA polymerase sigma-54 factor
MTLSARLQLRQAQSLVMTPQLLQSIRLLQFSHVELERFIDDEIERNPLVERVADEGPVASDDAPSGEAADADWSETALPDADAIADRFDASLENLYPDDPGRADGVGPDLALHWKSAPGSSGAATDFSALDNLAGPGISLRDHVMEQANLAFRGIHDRLIAADLADQLDEAGYFRGTVAETAARLGVAETDVDRVLLRCCAFEPAGLFARDLAECLALQLAARDRLDPAMAAMVGNLELVARRDYAQLRRVCGVDDEDLVEMMRELRALDPRPGTAFTAGVADPVVPDVIVRAAPDGSWAIELNPATLPRVLVDQAYYQKVQRRTADTQEREFLTGCLQSANWLARSLDQRARTILKVATEIVRQQDGFMVAGVEQLRPLNLRTVADAIGMHESTVSRVTSGKFMMTPRGVFELRYFFTVAIASSQGGDAHSSEAVRRRIREMIEREATEDVLSDDTIVDRLREAGVEIARRTVAKYRESMSIPSSVQRRREKRATASVGA